MVAACKLPGRKKDDGSSREQDDDGNRDRLGSAGGGLRIQLERDGAGRVQNDLGDKYAEGGGNAPDPAKGAMYYQKGCDRACASPVATWACSTPTAAASR